MNRICQEPKLQSYHASLVVCPLKLLCNIIVSCYPNVLNYQHAVGKQLPESLNKLLWNVRKTSDTPWIQFKGLGQGGRGEK